MSDIKLKPCPFCGKMPNVCDNLNPRNPIIDDRTRYAVRCTFGCFVITKEYRKKEDAINAWNTRKPMDRLTERLEGLKANVPNADFINGVVASLIEVEKVGGVDG